MHPGSSRHRYSRTSRISLLVVAGTLITSTSAAANPVPGGIYNGTHAGGGPIRFTVAADGSALTSYRIHAIPGDTCVFAAAGEEGSWPGTPVVNAGFAYELGSNFSIVGTFRADGSVSGTFMLRNGAVEGVKPACSSGTLSWSATTSGTPPAIGAAPPPPPQPAVTRPAKPTAPRPSVRTYRTTVLLRTRDRIRLTGRLRSLGPGCSRGRRVTVLSDGRPLKSVTSNVGGYFKFKRTASMRGRQISLRVSQRRLPNLICAAGKSRTVRIPGARRARAT